MRTERLGEDWHGFETKKIHAGHEISIFMPGMKIEISQSSLGRARFHAGHEIWLYMSGMKIELCMASMKIDSTCWA